MINKKHNEFKKSVIDFVDKKQETKNYRKYLTIINNNSFAETLNYMVENYDWKVGVGGDIFDSEPIMVSNENVADENLWFTMATIIIENDFYDWLKEFKQLKRYLTKLESYADLIEKMYREKKVNTFNPFEMINAIVKGINENS